MKIRAAPVVSEVNQEKWGHTYQKNGVFIIIEITSDKKKAIALKGREILDTLVSNLEKKEVATLAAVKREASEVFSNQSLNSDLGLNIICAKIVSSTLYLAIYGSGSVYIARGDLIAGIAYDAGSFSGRLKSFDRLFFFSPSLSQIIDASFLKKTRDMPVEEIKDEVTLLLRQRQIQGASGIVAEVEEEKETKDKPLIIGNYLNLIKKVWQKLRMYLLAKLRKLKAYNNRRLSILFILLTLFLTSIFFGSINRQKQQREQQLKMIEELVLQDIEEAEALIGINDTRAGVLIRQAKEKLFQVEGRQIAKLLDRIEELEIQALRIYQLDDVALFYDLTLIRPEAMGEDMALYRNNLYLLDRVNQAVYSVSVLDKKATVVAGGKDLAQAEKVAASGMRLFVLTRQGVVLADQSDKTAKLIVPWDNTWDEIVDMEAFAGNLYLLDKGNNSILKYQATIDGLGNKTVWLPNDASHQFLANSRMSIDGAIWTITNGKLARFMQGRIDTSVKISTIDQEISANADIYTDDEAEFVYILDRENKRVVVFDKKGSYQAQYIWQGIDDSIQMVVLEKQKKILLMKENLIYGIDLNI